MASEPLPIPEPESELIDPNDADALAAWAAKLDVTASQINDALDAVGTRAADVEMHLKGSRSTTNADRIDQAGGT